MGGERPCQEQNASSERRLALLLFTTMRRQGAEDYYIASREKYASNLWRLRIDRGGGDVALFAKLMGARDSRIVVAAAHRWLPQAGLERHATPLLGVSDEDPQGRVWHLYEDLGDCTLEIRHRGDRVRRRAKRGFLSPGPLGPVMDRTRAAVVTLARLHRTFANQPVLDDCRSVARELGSPFLGDSVRNAIRRLEKLGASTDRFAPQHEDARKHLLERLRQLEAEIPWRSAEIAELGGPDTLLHGDVHGGNVLVYREDDEWNVRFIDWAHAGVGPASYDLSNLLLHYDHRDRRTILGWYTAAAAPDHSWPSDDGWNAIFDTAERSRLACTVAWLTREALETPSDWVFQQLASVESWFARLTPVLTTRAKRTDAGASDPAPAAPTTPQ
jgi:thiamine kinase-like enzyme